MPQTDDATREEIKKIFGNIDYLVPLNVLKELGWHEHRGYLYPPYEYTDFESLLVKFLIEEWDFAI